MSAVEDFKGLSNLRMSWPSFIPSTSSVADAFFSPVVLAIRRTLSSSSIILCKDGRYRAPSSVKFPSSYCLDDDDGEPLIEEDDLPFYYISSDYPSGVHSKLRELGVGDMSFGDFLGGLSEMNHLLAKRSNSWLESVCQLISASGFNYRGGMTDSRIAQLPLASLQSGSWVSCRSASSLFFASDDLDFPSDLDIDIVVLPGKTPERRRLLQKLGVKDISPKLVVDKIIDKHSANWHSGVSALLNHIVYVFRHRHDLSAGLGKGSLWLADTSGRACRGSDLYMDEPGIPGNLIRLSEALLSPARFLHPDFVQP